MLANISQQNNAAASAISSEASIRVLYSYVQTEDFLLLCSSGAGKKKVEQRKVVLKTLISNSVVDQKLVNLPPLSRKNA